METKVIRLSSIKYTMHGHKSPTMHEHKSHSTKNEKIIKVTMDEHWNYTLGLKIAYCMNTKVELLHDACAQRLTQWRDTIKSIVAEYIGFFVLFALSVTTTPFCHDSCRAIFWQKWMDVYLLHSHTFYWGYYYFLQDHRHCIRTFLMLTQ